MSELILVRGAPGSGKSTHARHLEGIANSEGTISFLFEADEYFVRPDGVYDFNFKLLPNAHKWCQGCVKDTLNLMRKLKHSGVAVVANTFTRLWEMQPYLDIAKECGATVKVYRCSGEYQNIHGVPDDKVRLMRERMEPFEGEEWV